MHISYDSQSTTFIHLWSQRWEEDSARQLRQMPGPVCNYRYTTEAKASTWWWYKLSTWDEIKHILKGFSVAVELTIKWGGCLKEASDQLDKDCVTIWWMVSAETISVHDLENFTQYARHLDEFQHPQCSEQAWKRLKTSGRQLMPSNMYNPFSVYLPWAHELPLCRLPSFGSSVLSSMKQWPEGANSPKKIRLISACLQKCTSHAVSTKELELARCSATDSANDVYPRLLHHRHSNFMHPDHVSITKLDARWLP